MRASAYISLIFLLTLGACSSTQYAGSEYDDLYYSSSDKPVVKNQSPVNEQIAEQNLSVNDYYDNMYAVDTLVSDQFNDAAQKDNQVIINNNYGGGYDYYDSYSGRLNMFYGNYFDPYWQDPYYFSAGYGYGYPYSGMSMGFGFGYPYFSFGFNYGNPYYGYGYGGYYGGYYPPYYGGYYPGYCCGYYPVYGNDDSYVNYGRRERPSTLSSRTGTNTSAGGGYSRRDPSVSSRAASSGGGRSYAGTEAASTESRRTIASTGNGVSKTSASGRSTSQESKGTSSRSGVTTQQGSVNNRPEYKSSNRTYLPSYNNPRMSTRPSYNNSRTIGSEPGTRSGSSSYNRPPSGNNSSQKSSISRSGNAVQYSVPARRSSDGGGNTSSGSYNRSSSGYSGGSRSYSGSESRSYSSGSSSYSGGSSSSGSSSHSSSGSSSGRR